MIRLVSVVKIYGTGRGRGGCKARQVSLDVDEQGLRRDHGRVRPSKSTLMNIIGCLDVPSEGKFLIDGIDTQHPR